MNILVFRRKPLKAFNRALLLLSLASFPSFATTVRMQTSLGDIDIQLMDAAAPATVANFLNYVTSGAYVDSFIHRSVPGFIIQGGGYRWNSASNGVGSIPANAPVINEFSASRSNLRGTIAIAKLGNDPNSATNQWFFNLADNSGNLDNQNGGFTVFGQVIGDGMQVVDAIAALPIVNANGANPSGAFGSLPLITLPTDGIARQNLVTISAMSVLTVPVCSITASPASISPGGSTTLAVSCNPATTSYIWSGGACAGTSAASCAVTPASTTTYSVAGINVLGAGSNASVTVTVAASVQVVEFYNINLDNYFITADANEAAAIDSGSAGSGWSRTGNSFKSGGSTSVCRFYGSYTPGPNSHFYTVDPGECQSLKDQQFPAGDPRKLTVKSWNFESLDFVSTPATNQTCPGGTTPVYRAYNNGFARGIDSNHRITSSLTAIQEVVTRGWNNEGVVMCAPN